MDESAQPYLLNMDATSPRRPRVLHAVSHLALGGAERVALSLAENLPTRYEFSFYAVRGVADGAVGLGLQQHLRTLGMPLATGLRVPMRFGGLITGAIGLARCVRRVKPDLIHLHTEIPEASYAVMVALFPALRRIRLVRTIHNSVIWHFSPRLGVWCDRRMGTGCIAGVSNAAVEAFHSLRAASGAGDPPVEPVTIYNGVRAPISARAPAARGDVIRMVYGGRFEAEKGTDLLPAIVAQTRLPPGQKAHLTILGSGRHEPLLRALAQQPPEGWTIEVQPPIANFAQGLVNFDLALLPSRYEGLALTAIEALLAGIQLVVADAPGLRETVPPNHPWLARVEDPASFASTLSYACANRDRWPGIAEFGRRFATTHFSLEQMADGYDALYQHALG